MIAGNPSKPLGNRAGLLSRAALGVALSLGTMAGVAAIASPALAAPAKVSFSPGFTKAAADFDKTLAGAKSNAAVNAASARAQAATTPQAKAAAAAEVDAALGGAKAKLAVINAAVSTPGDKLKAGEMTRNVGVLENDVQLQHQGLVMMIDSNGLAPDMRGQVLFLTGVTAYQMGDYAGAVQYLKPAMDSGYRDPQNMLAAVLADSYKRTNNTGAAASLAQQDLAAARAAGRRPSETALRSALQAAYDAKQTASAVDLAAELGRDYPGPSSWNSSIVVVRALTGLPAQDNLDLMRLMQRTGAMNSRQDYLEYLQDADARRLPGETLKVIDAGIASGKITAADVREERQVASGRVAADRASLAGLERIARGPGASGVTVVGMADAYLSYDQPAKAEEFYRMALAKPGVDQSRVLLRLGIAQSDQGKYGEAAQSFAKVTGPRAPVAKLWAAYVASKGAPAA